ncbi:hypothetical protein [Streptomyces sp. NPDC059009]|uniref:hypothetical protein n=1 Tax=Streptomyces sp. NPDC059009 TaxID=3346694 RepID=UPI00369CB0C5
MKGETKNLPNSAKGLVTVTATCPSGTVVVGGGFEHGTRIDRTSADIKAWFWESKSNTVNNSWQVSYQQDDNNAGATFPITAYAQCLSYGS